MMNGDSVEARLERLERHIRKVEERNPRFRERYPYTYAADFLKSNFNAEDRSDASGKMREIAKILGEDNHYRVAKVFAEAFIQEKGENNV